MDKLLDWIKEHDMLSINRLEERAGIPQRSLHKAIKGIRPLPDKYVKPLIKILKQYGYKYLTPPDRTRGGQKIMYDR